LPRYTLRKRLKNGCAYFFNVPLWARKEGCPIENEALGTSYDSAVDRAERVLLPAFDDWRTGGKPDPTTNVGIVPETLDWLFHEWRQTWNQGSMKRVGPMSAGQRRVNNTGIKLIGNYVLKDGTRLGTRFLKKIDRLLVNDLYGKLLVKTGKDGERTERRTTVNHAFKSARTAWNTVGRSVKLPPNPFEKLGLHESNKERAWAVFGELKIFHAKAIEMGFPSIATAALVGWEFLQRKDHIFTEFKVDHYRPRHMPDHIYIINTKTNTGEWEPLFDEDGNALYPALMAELDAMKAKRPTGGLMLRRDKDGREWAGKTGSLSYLEHRVRDIITAAELRPELSFTSFGRHGGATEAEHSGLTQAELMHKGQWSSTKAMKNYLHGNDELRQQAQQKRLARRAKNAARKAADAGTK
jgi:hypothetical protein